MIVRYEGLVESFHVFRIAFTGKPIEHVKSRMTITDWLFAKARGKTLSGNRFDEVTIPYANPKKADWFVLFDSMADVRLFEERFKVIGYSPSMGL